jgi:hypothetical protein
MPIREFERVLSICETDENLGKWTANSFTPLSAAGDAEDCNVLVVPFTNHMRDKSLVYFPGGTRELLLEFSRSEVSELSSGISSTDKDYVELDLHSDSIHFAKLVVEWLVAPVVVGLLVNFLVQTFGRRFGKGHVTSTLVLSCDGDKKSIELKYDGPASTYEAAMREAISTVNGNPASTSPVLDKSQGVQDANS